MNALILWIVLPILTSIALFFIRRWRNALHVAAIFQAFVLAWLAWQLPIGEGTSIRLWSGFPAFKVAESLTILGQRFTLADHVRPVIMLIFLGVGFWLVGAFLVRVDQIFVPLSLAISALQVAALSAESGVQVPVILELIALVTLPLLSPPGKPTRSGALRFLTYQTIGACLILISEHWQLLSSPPVNSIQNIPLPYLVMGLGYAFILAVIPFHTWVPKTGEETDPYTAAFIFYTIPVGIAFLVLKNLDRYVLLGAPPSFFSGITSVGILVVLAGGIAAAFERNLGRILGYTALTQSGVLILALGLSDPRGNNTTGVGILFSLLVPMGTGLAVWALALRIISPHLVDLRLDSVRGLVRTQPIPAICLLLAQFSLAGLPLLASFPIYAAQWTILAQESLKSALLFTIGIAFLFIGCLRTLAALASTRSQESRRSTEGKLLHMILMLGVTILFVAGMAPQWLVPWLTSLGGVFTGSNP